MEAVRSQPSIPVRSWRLVAVTLLFLVLVIGGAAGYALRLTTAPTQTIVRTVPAAAAAVQPAGSSASQSTGASNSYADLCGPASLHSVVCQ
ncbi:MAG: hypothetical protein WCB85_06605 [Candidatus Dormiibacterota bacterium]